MAVARVKLTIDHDQVAADLSDYRLYVTADMLPEGVWDEIVDTANGLDVRFFASDDETELDREIVAIDVDAETIEAWVLLPTISSTEDTIVWCHVGGDTAPNAGSAVWGGDYTSVYHFAGDAVDACGDSDGSVSGAVASSGLTGSAYNLSSGDYIERGAAMNVTNEHIAVEVLAKIDLTVGIHTKALITRAHFYEPDPGRANAGFCLVAKDDGAVAYRVMETIDGDGGYKTCLYETAAGVITTDTWHWIAVYVYLNLYNSNREVTIWVDGVEKATTKTEQMGGLVRYDDIMKTRFGAAYRDVYDTHWPIAAEIDEVRLMYGAVPSGNRLLTEYTNTTSAAFVSESTYYPPMTADFSSSPSQQYAGVPIQFTDLSTGNVTSWLWDFGDGETSTEQNPTHTYAASGSYTVSLTVSDGATSDVEEKDGHKTVWGASATPTTGDRPLRVQFRADEV